MGRKQKRREIKSNRNKKLEENITSEDMIKASSIVKIVLGVVVVILVFYYGLAIFVTKEVNLSSNNKKSEDTKEDSSNNSVSNAILAKNTFNQMEEVYYVYYYDFNDENDVISNSIGGLTDHTIYRVDTNSGLNSNYVVEDESNRNVTSIDNLKVKNPTIIKVDNDKVVSYYEGIDEISKFLNK